MGLRAAEDQPIGHAERRRTVADTRQIRPQLAVAQLAADDDQARRARPGPARAQPGIAIDQEIDPLDRVDPPDEEEVRIIAEAERRARGGAVGGAEAFEVDAAGDGGDARGARPVPPDDLGTFPRVARDDRIDPVDQAALAIEPQRRLAAIGGTARRLFLQRGQGVEHLHDRRGPIAPQGQGDPPGKPIVRVDDVVADAIAQAEVGHLRREVVRERKKILLAHRGGRTGGDMDDANVMRQFHDRGGVGIAAPRKNIDRDTLPA